MQIGKRGKKSFWVAMGLCVIVLLVTFFSKESSKQPGTSQTTTPSEPSKKPVSCDYETKKMVMPDESMMPKIKKGQKLTLTQGWYRCHQAIAGEVVLFQFSKQFDPVIRLVRAVQGDHFALKQDKVHKAWNVAINGKLLLTESGETHFFGAMGTPPLLSLYEKNRAKGLESDEALIFAANSQARFDSGELGLVSSTDFLGKIEIVE